MIIHKIRKHFEFIKHKKNDSLEECLQFYLALTLKIIQTLENLISTNTKNTYDAKQEISNNHTTIDSSYSKHLYWINPKKQITRNDKMNAKFHSTQIDSVI